MRYAWGIDVVHMQSIHVSAEESLRGSHSESSATHRLILSTTAIPTIPKSCPGWVCPTETPQHVLLGLLPFGFALSHCHQVMPQFAAVPTDWMQCDIMTYRKWCYIWLYLASQCVLIIQVLTLFTCEYLIVQWTWHVWVATPSRIFLKNTH